MAIGRIVLWGLLIGGVAGAATGLVLGLIAYPPTAWFAVIEVGVPGAVTGAVVGLMAGLFVIGRRRARSRSTLPR